MVAVLHKKYHLVDVFLTKCSMCKSSYFNTVSSRKWLRNNLWHIFHLVFLGHIFHYTPYNCDWFCLCGSGLSIIHLWLVSASAVILKKWYFTFFTYCFMLMCVLCMGVNLFECSVCVSSYIFTCNRRCYVRRLKETVVCHLGWLFREGSGGKAGGWWTK